MEKEGLIGSMGLSVTRSSTITVENLTRTTLTNSAPLHCAPELPDACTARTGRTVKMCKKCHAYAFNSRMPRNRNHRQVYNESM
jgi:hypothetical protein